MVPRAKLAPKRSVENTAERCLSCPSWARSSGSGTVPRVCCCYGDTTLAGLMIARSRRGRGKHQLEIRKGTGVRSHPCKTCNDDACCGFPKIVRPLRRWSWKSKVTQCSRTGLISGAPPLLVKPRHEKQVPRCACLREAGSG